MYQRPRTNSTDSQPGSGNVLSQTPSLTPQLHLVAADSPSSSSIPEITILPPVRIPVSTFTKFADSDSLFLAITCAILSLDPHRMRLEGRCQLGRDKAF